MLRKLRQFSCQRQSWVLLTLIALLLEITALGFQYLLGQKPCVLCVYQRAALAGVILAGVVGMIAPRTPLRWLALVGWIVASAKIFSLTWQQTQLQLHPPLFATCDFFPKFPSWLPLNQWLPAVFSPTGTCTDRSLTLLSYSLPEWLLGISFVMLVVAIVVLFAQFLSARND